MDTQLLIDQGFRPLGMVSRYDTYLVHPETAMLAHGIEMKSDTHWFFDKKDLDEIFAILTVCVHHQIHSSLEPNTSLDGKNTFQFALEKMVSLFPTFRLASTAVTSSVCNEA